MAKDYNQLATSQYDVGYNQQVQNLKNQLATQLGDLESSKTGINNNFNNQVNAQNLQSTKTKNNFSNQVLSRGIGRSTVATSGLGEMDNINTRMVGDIETNRTNSLGDVDRQKNVVSSNINNNLSTMAADRVNAIAKLARELEDRDWQKQMEEQKLALQREAQRQAAAQQAAALAFQKQQYAASQAEKSRAAALSKNQEKMGYQQAFDAIANDSKLSTAQKRQQINNLAEMTNGYDADLYAYGTNYDKNYNNDLIQGGYSYSAPSSSSSGGGLWNSIKGIFSGGGSKSTGLHSRY